jgi:hypothetical protein
MKLEKGLLGYLVVVAILSGSAAGQIIVVPQGGRVVMVREQLNRKEIEMTPGQARQILNKYAGIEAEAVPAETVRRYIDQLGDRDWRVRKRATEELLAVGKEARDQIAEAKDSPDAEIAARARHILSVIDKDSDDEGMEIRKAVSVLLAEGQNDLPRLLIEALDDPRVNVRRAAAGSLRRATANDLGYYASDSREARQEAAKKWRQWWAKQSATYKYDPSKESAVLVCDPPRRTVLAMTLDGKLLWKREVAGEVVSAYPRENGNLLLAYRGQSQVVEIDPKGKVVWRSGDDANIQGLFDFRVLAGGNLLMVDDPGGKVVQIDREGKVVWKHDGLNHPHGAYRDAAGNTVIAEHLGHRILVVSPEGKVRKSFDGQRAISDVSPYRDGSRYMVSARMGNEVKVALVNLETGKDEMELYKPGWPVTSGVVTPEGFVFSANQGDGVAWGPVGAKVRRSGIPRPDMWGKVRVAPRGLVEAAGGEKRK